MNNIQEREINLVDLFWEICLKWRIILLIALIFMILAGGFDYIRSRLSVSATVPEIEDETEPEKVDEQQDIQLSEESMEKVNRYYEYVELRDAQKSYIEHSPLMQLDATGFYLNKISYYVDNHFQVEYPLLNKRDNINAIVAAYLMSLQENDFDEKMYNLLGGSEEEKLYLRELVDISNGYGDIIKTSTSSVGIIEIFVYGQEESSSKALAELVKETIEEKQEDIVRSFGEHDLILLESVSVPASDNGLRTYQKSQYDSYIAYENTVKGLRDALSKEEQLYVQLKEEGISEKDEPKSNDEADDVTKTTSSEGEKEAVSEGISLNLKYLIIGFIGGAFLGCFLVAMLYILNGKLRLVDDIETLYQIKLFGQIEVNKEPERKRWFAFVDSWIRKLRDWNKHSFTWEEAVSMVVAGVRICARNAEVSRIYVTGASIGEAEKELLEELSAKLGNAGVELIPGNPILYNADALEKSSEIGCVLLLEKAGSSLYQEVADELETCSYQGIKVLGMVMVA